ELRSDTGLGALAQRHELPPLGSLRRRHVIGQLALAQSVGVQGGEDRFLAPHLLAREHPLGAGGGILVGLVGEHRELHPLKGVIASMGRAPPPPSRGRRRPVDNSPRGEHKRAGGAPPPRRSLPLAASPVPSAAAPAVPPALRLEQPRHGCAEVEQRRHQCHRHDQRVCDLPTHLLPPSGRATLAPATHARQTCAPGGCVRSTLLPREYYPRNIRGVIVTDSRSARWTPTACRPATCSTLRARRSTGTSTPSCRT